MAPVKNPNNNAGSSSKATAHSISSSSSSSVLESSPTASSCISSDPSLQSTSRSHGCGGIVSGTVTVEVEARPNESLGMASGNGLGVVASVGGGGGAAGTNASGNGGCSAGSLSFVSSATQATTVPQSGGIGAVGGAMATNAYVLRKNTEVVAPIRREFKDFNDYFLSVTESSQASTSATQFKRQNHHYHHRHQPPVTPLAGPSSLDSATCFDFDTFADNQRSCYPVRPIPRRTPQARDDNQQPNHSHNHNHSHSLHTSSCGIPINNQTATVGVVNPTTPGINTEEPIVAYHSRQQSTNPFVRYRAPEPTHNDTLDIDELLLQRYKYIQYCIKLANKQQPNSNTKGTMVNENNENETIVNSTSLEDVALSETSERAQSVTSIHSAAEPATPTYEDLQSRLEASTRSIQNMKEQQQQLMHLQNQAKEHLAEMERLRSQAAPLRRGIGPNGAPDYESIEQVHTDMSSLVGRMKNLTTFIQGQNELSNLLGEDGPDILAEQQTLQQKLEGLKSHRDEMKNLILELHEVNRMAERRAYEQQQQEQQPQEKSDQSKAELPSGSRTSMQREQPPRVVPVEYSRNVPIELVNAQKQQQQQQSQENHQVNGDVSHDGAQTSEDELGDDPETAALIQQKMADLQTMKNKLSHLKTMMETVKLIEERTEGLSPREIGYTNPPSRRSVEIPVQRESTPKVANTKPRTFDKDRTPVQDDFNDDPEDPAITDKIHILNEVTRDLRSQALSLATERDRIRALKEDIIRRKAANAAAAAAGTSQRAGSSEENKSSNRERASPAKASNEGGERDLLKEQYEAKKKEFQNLCERMESVDVAATSITAPSREERDDEVDEEDDEELLNRTDDTPKPDLGYYYSQSQGVSCNSSLHGSGTKTRGKESVDSTATDVQGVPSCEAGSIKSSSSRSYSVPPPMRSINNREASWRKTSQEHYDHYGSTIAPSAVGSSGPAPPPLPTLWNPCHFYNAPYSPHFPTSNTVVSGTNSECMCQANLSTLPNGSATPAGSTLSQSEPVMVQQFIQTQQMLINSVCQCNQMLWHQQREIDALNSTVHMLQERLLSHTNGTDLAATHRSESVPPAGTVQNNLCPSLNRAQSEQPNHFAPLNPHHAHHLPGMLSQSTATYHRRNMCNIQQQQLSNTGFNFAAADQQISNSMYSSAATNLCPPMPPMPNFNNTASVPNNTSGTPIFMHHHNNTQHPVHNNNSNLQNATQQQSQNSASVTQNSQPVSGASGASNLTGSALNNQVPPGNRANNYWDNFRSYSRQNLLSSNSCKSNEEQNNQHQQLQQQPSSHLTLHQQESPSLPIFTNSLNVGYRSDSNINNLNPPNYDNKYLHTFRNRINTNSALPNGNSGLLNAPPANSSASSTHAANYRNMMNITGINQPDSQQQQQTHSAWSGTPNTGDPFEANELAQDMRNMNLNFGNNEPNKVPIKPSSLRRPNPSTSRRSARHPSSDAGSFMTLQQEPSIRSDVTGADLPSPSVFSGALDSVPDDTSDEIKRNLLVNALKSDKFTTKFYESLKEDVFRRIETLLRGKDGEQQFLAQVYRDYNIASTRDPLRKLYLNEVRSLSRPLGTMNGTESNGTANDDDDDEDGEPESSLPENHNVLNNSNIEAQNANALGLNAKDIKLLADKFAANTASTSAAAMEQTFQFPDYELIHYIVARIHEDTQPTLIITDAALAEIARLTAIAIQNHAIVKCRNREIIEARLHISPKRIFAKLKAKAFPRDRDGFLAWYQRYLETVLFVTLKRGTEDDPQPSRENQSVASTSNRNSNQNLLLPDVQCVYMNTHQARKSNIPLRHGATCSGLSSAPSETESKIENNSVQRQQQQHQRTSQPIPSNSAQHQHHVQVGSPTTPPTPCGSSSGNIINEDLAEADQVCSSSNPSILGSTDAHIDDSFHLCESQPPPQQLPDNAEGQLISIPSDVHANHAQQNFLNFLLDETENNENPEEEGHHHHVSTNTIQPLESVLHSFPADSDNAEEDADGQNQRPESSIHGVFGTDPCLTVSGTVKRNSVA